MATNTFNFGFVRLHTNKIRLAFNSPGFDLISKILVLQTSGDNKTVWITTVLSILSKIATFKTISVLFLPIMTINTSYLQTTFE